MRTNKHEDVYHLGQPQSHVKPCWQPCFLRHIKTLKIMSEYLLTHDEEQNHRPYFFWHLTKNLLTTDEGTRSSTMLTYFGVSLIPAPLYHFTL